ncbi:Wzz/FepE/Etk N-terminal domain-containing protein [Pseudothauera rhizosphaerae]|nr:Wzz/FepE/Etk N-terminal domain-containing protein [Pseudothauera rhizosphaerae]
MHNSQPSPQAYADSEIDLFELWQTLVRRRLLILASLTFCLATGVAFALLYPPVYEANVKLRIGQVQASDGLLENATELAARIIAEHGEEVAEGIKRDRPFVTGVSIEKGITTTLQLTVEGDTPEDAARLLRDVANSVQARHNAVYEENLKPISERLARLGEQRAALQQQFDDITEQFELLKERDSVQASLVMLERGPIINSINQHDEERLRLAQQVTPPQSRPTELLGEIVEPAKPSKPRKVLALVLAAVLGLMAGIFLAFVTEFVSRIKNTSSENAS